MREPTGASDASSALTAGGHSSLGASGVNRLTERRGGAPAAAAAAASPPSAAAAGRGSTSRATSRGAPNGSCRCGTRLTVDANSATSGGKDDQLDERARRAERLPAAAPSLPDAAAGGDSAASAPPGGGHLTPLAAPAPPAAASGVIAAAGFSHGSCARSPMSSRSGSIGGVVRSHGSYSAGCSAASTHCRQWEYACSGATPRGGHAAGGAARGGRGAMGAPYGR